jgi:hypothetical protein
MTVRLAASCSRPSLGRGLKLKEQAVGLGDELD